MPSDSDTIDLSEQELREITGFAAASARRVLSIFERRLPADARPREAIEAAETFAGGGRRSGTLRQSSWAAFRAAGQATSPAAVEAARAASNAAGAAYLHPRASAHQVRHVLGATAAATRAEELAAGDDPHVSAETFGWARRHAPHAVSAVLGRLPTAPSGGGRVGEIVRDLDAALRS